MNIRAPFVWFGGAHDRKSFLHIFEFLTRESVERRGRKLPRY